MWEFYVDDCTEGRYNINIGRDLLITLGINIKLSDHNIECVEGPYQGFTEKLNDCNLKTININMRPFFIGVISVHILKLVL